MTARDEGTPVPETHWNDGVSRVLWVQPQGTNSTMFTDCCRVAVCDDQPKCPRCDRNVIGWDAATDNERGRVRWQHATAYWREP